MTYVPRLLLFDPPTTDSSRTLTTPSRVKLPSSKNVKSLNTAMLEEPPKAVLPPPDVERNRPFSRSVFWAGRAMYQCFSQVSRLPSFHCTMMLFPLFCHRPHIFGSICLDLSMSRSCGGLRRFL